MANPNVIKLMLPKATTSQAMAKQQVSLSVTGDRKYYLNNKEVPFSNLENEISSTIRNIKEPTIVLRVDNALTVQDLVDVLTIGNNMKVKMVLATKSQQK